MSLSMTASAVANRRYRAKHPDRVRASHARYLAANREALYATAAAKRDASREEYNRHNRDTYDPTARRQSHMKSRFGLTLEQYEAMVQAQHNLCAICGQPERQKRNSGASKPLGLAVDHDHQTGRVRGLLCRACNRALGGFYDDPVALRAAADYLERCH